MVELWDDGGHLLPASIEWSESSGPVSPRFQYGIHLTVGPEADAVRVTCERRDSSGTNEGMGILGRDRYQALWQELLALLPLGTRLELPAGVRHRKGISFNHVTLSLGGAAARIDYVLSQAGEDGGDPRIRAVVGAIRAACLPILDVPPPAP